LCVKTDLRMNSSFALKAPGRWYREKGNLDLDFVPSTLGAHKSDLKQEKRRRITPRPLLRHCNEGVRDAVFLWMLVRRHSWIRRLAGWHEHFDAALERVDWFGVA